MASASSVVPCSASAYLRQRDDEPSSRVALLVALSVALCGLAGCYPRIEDGIAFRLVYSPAAVRRPRPYVASEARSWHGAFGAPWGSLVLSVLITFLPGLMVSFSKSGTQPFAGIHSSSSSNCSAVPPAWSALPLAVLAGVVYRHLHANTHEARDRVVRAVSIWTMLVATAPTSSL